MIIYISKKIDLLNNIINKNGKYYDNKCYKMCKKYGFNFYEISSNIIIK